MQQIDLIDAEDQFQDRGASYTTVIFYYTEMQREAAKKSKDNLAVRGIFAKPIVTPIRNTLSGRRIPSRLLDNRRRHYQEDCARSGRKEFIAERWGSNERRVVQAFYMMELARKANVMIGIKIMKVLATRTE